MEDLGLARPSDAAGDNCGVGRARLWRAVGVRQWDLSCQTGRRPSFLFPHPDGHGDDNDNDDFDDDTCNEISDYDENFKDKF